VTYIRLIFYKWSFFSGDILTLKMCIMLTSSNDLITSTFTKSLQNIYKNRINRYDYSTKCFQNAYFLIRNKALTYWELCENLFVFSPLWWRKMKVNVKSLDLYCLSATPFCLLHLSPTCHFVKLKKGIISFNLVSRSEAVFLVVCDPSMKELWAT